MSDNIEIGSLRERVTLQSPLRTPDGAGGAEVSWTAGATLWAKVETRGGGEAFASERLAAHARFRVTIRHRAGVTAEMRLLWGGRALAISALGDPDGRRRFLVLDCREERI